MDQPNNLTSRLVAKRRELLDQLEKVDKALEVLKQKPEIGEVFEGVILTG